MLTRAAQRRRCQHVLSFYTASDSLLLPWLCPALVRLNHFNAATISTSEPRRPKPHKRASNRIDTRHLATHLDSSFSLHASKDPIPFVGSWSSPLSNDQSSTLSALGPWNPLLIPDEKSTHIRMVQYNGIGGDSDEIMQNLHASLRVGRLDRAANLIRRMKLGMNAQEPQLLRACNDYLGELVDRLRDGTDVTYQDLQQWFEVDIKGYGIEPNAQTFILMVKGCMMGLTGSKQERTLRRYLALAQQVGDDVWAQLISSGEFTGMEWSRLVQLQPYHLRPLPQESESFAEDDPAIEIETLANHVKAPLLIASDPSPPELPEPRDVAQKGAGLKTLKKTLAIFRPEGDVPYPHDFEGTKEERDHAWAIFRQRKLEEDTYAAALGRWRQENEQMAKLGINSKVNAKSLEMLLLKWHTALVPAIKEELKEIRAVLDAASSNAVVKDPRAQFGAFMEQFTAEKLAAVAVIAFLNLFVGEGLADGIRLSTAAFKVADRLEAEQLELHRKKARNTIRRSKISAGRREMLSKLYRGPSPLPATVSEDEIDRAREVLRAHSKVEWPRLARARIGVLLIHKIIENAKIEFTRTDPKSGISIKHAQPAFAHTLVYRAGKRAGMVKAHQVLVERLSQEPVKGLLGAQLPMVCPPRPWTTATEGGYLNSPTSVVRQRERDVMQRIYVHTASEKGDLDQIYAGLNVLGKTPWKINREVLNVMLEAWNSGEAVAKIAPEEPEFPIPPKPPAEHGTTAKNAWLKQLRMIENEKAGLHSQRCFQNFQMEIGRAYADEVFYYPHNLDFRGRAYPVPALLNHMGSDLPRGMLMFANGKELGENGLFWLKVHLANVYGYDKASLRGREQFTEDHLDDIFDSAKHPLNGKRWWLNAEDPWQCLAACKDLTHALESDDVTRYISHLAIHQDGTCNGLQHYAALGGDRAGASQVNLEPGDRPADIYTAVAELVKTEIAEEAANGHPLSSILDGKITRKVVKQTVMTNVYGVTFIGARAQVLKQLEALMPHYFVVDAGPSMMQLAAHVARKIFKALSTMFTGATEIQTWFADCANRICMSVTPEQLERAREFLEKGEKSHNSPYYRKPKGQPKSPKLGLSQILQYKNSVVWTTPLKLPVVQPYRSAKYFQVSTSLQHVYYSNPRSSDPVHKRKQLQAFPPNFIHSLDATHMLLSALKCDEVGLTFASVHDSFWTHASDVPTLSRILRDAFIRMHSEDIMGRLAEEFKVRYKGCIYSKSFAPESPIGRAVAKFRKEQKLTGWEGRLKEMFMEQERQNLLKSDDERERRRGKSMVTPASIIEARSGISTVPTSEGLDVTTLGAVPQDESKGIDKPERNRGRPRTIDGPDIRMESPLHADESKMVKNMLSSPSGLEELEIEADQLGTAPDDTEDDLIGEIEDILGLDSDRRKAEKQEGKNKPSRGSSLIHVWLPLTFPELPKKGDFEVARLRDSQYFFS